MYEIQIISEAYVSYIRKNYGNKYIVFDRYDEVIQQNQIHMQQDWNLKVHHKMWLYKKRMKLFIQKSFSYQITIIRAK